MIREVLKTTGITATVGIGTNLYLAKVAMDIVAKKQPADKDSVRIAELNEDSYKFLLCPALGTQAAGRSAPERPDACRMPI